MVAILRAMHARALALGLLLISTGCTRGEDGGRPQPFAARIVCSVERWLQQNDYRRREPGHRPRQQSLEFFPLPIKSPKSPK